MTTSSPPDCLDEANESINLKIQHRALPPPRAHLNTWRLVRTNPTPRRADFVQTTTQLQTKNEPTVKYQYKKKGCHFFPQSNKGFLGRHFGLTQFSAKQWDTRTKEEQKNTEYYLEGKSISQALYYNSSLLSHYQQFQSETLNAWEITASA